jgi:hypothetical protein
LKWTSALIALLPFGFGLPIEDEPLIRGVDRAQPGNDKTAIAIYSLGDYAEAAGISFWQVNDPEPFVTFESWRLEYLPNIEGVALRTLDEMLQPGQKIKEFYGEGNINNRTLHIRAIVDDNAIVFRVWAGGTWNYHVSSRYNLEYKYEKGRLS